MSLWIPYDPEQVLDLSKAAAIVKIESKLLPPLADIASSVYPDHTQHQQYYVTSPLTSPASLQSSLYGDCSPHHPHYYQHYYDSSPLLSPSSLQRTSLYGDCSPPASSPDSGSERVTSSTKLPRPFKAVTAALPECGASVDPDPSYAEFRAAMLKAMRARNGGSLTVSNPHMRRSVHRSSEAGEDSEYLERRARNNAAAKRSRDLRKQKEDELAIRIAFLERQNAELRAARRRCAHCFTRYAPY